VKPLKILKHPQTQSMQTTDTVLMIEPIAFGFNAETAKNNYFQVEQKGLIFSLKLWLSSNFC
jgi:hypothetical protein